jgi:hypothetical protein
LAPDVRTGAESRADVTTLTQIFLGLWIGFTIAGVVMSAQGNGDKAAVFLCLTAVAGWAYILSSIWKPKPKDES